MSRNPPGGGAGVLSGGKTAEGCALHFMVF